MAKGIDPKNGSDGTESPTFREFAETVFLPYARKTRKSINDIESRLNRWLMPALGDKPL